MRDIKQLHVGSKVRYQPAHYKERRWENGIVKEILKEITTSVWVVYNCADNWDRYTEYASAETRLEDLRLDWK
jgi:hypothetical protein